MRRERQYKIRIGELESLLSESRAKKNTEGSLESTMDNLRRMHRTIMDNVDQVQDRTSQILQEQEKDLLRAFRARLYSVQEELESEKNKTDDGASAWIEKSKQLENEVEWTKELADRLDRLNQSLTRENQRLKTQFSTQENDREFLVKQLVGVKKDNVRLRNEYDALQRQLEQLKDETQQQQYQQPSFLPGSMSTSALPRVNTSGGLYQGGGALAYQQRPHSSMSTNGSMMPNGASFMAPDADNRYKEIIKRLKRLLETERRNLQQVRMSYKQEMQTRTELELILHECVRDVRAEITAQSASQLPSVMLANNSHGQQPAATRRTDTIGPSQTDNNRLSAVDRQRLVERLLGKERLLNLLTARAFPITRSGKLAGADPLLTGEAQSSDDMGRLYADVASSSVPVSSTS